MAEPALREQLKKHFARRVTRQAIAVIKLYQFSVDSQWANQKTIAHLLEESEKLTQLANRFEMQAIESAGYQITSLLKLGGASPANSQTVLKGLENAISVLTHHQKSVSEKPPINHSEKSVTIALNDDLLAQQLEDVFIEHGFSTTCATKQTSHEQLIANKFLLIDIDFPSENKGFQLAAGLKQDDTRKHHLMFLNFALDDTQRRLKAIRAGGQAFIQNPSSALHILDEVFSIHTQHKNITPRVLIVDDSISQAKFTENILQKNALHCHTLNDPMQLCSALNTYRPDLILMDMYMPQCNGIELAAVLRQHHDFGTTPIIFLSAEDDARIQKRAAAFSNSQFMSKPPAPTNLLRAIEQALSALN